MENYFNSFFDFFLPRFCAACKTKLLPGENIICVKCLTNIHFAEDQRIQHEFDRKFKTNGFIKDFTSLYVFERSKEFQELIHQLKYNKRFRIGLFIGNRIAFEKTELINNWKIDLIIPVPLHHLKKAERGYNQSYFIAKGLATSLNLKATESVIKRVRYTESQTLKNIHERQENVSGAFKIKRKKNIKGKNILLVDDVITTGATINECARQLLENGAKNIYAISAAIAD